MKLFDIHNDAMVTCSIKFCDNSCVKRWNSHRNFCSGHTADSDDRYFVDISASAYFRSVVLITSALHAEGPGFELQRNHSLHSISSLYILEKFLFLFLEAFLIFPWLSFYILVRHLSYHIKNWQILIIKSLKVNVPKFSNTFLFLFSNKILVFRTLTHNSKQGRPWSECFFRSSLITLCDVCLGIFGRQLVFVILEQLCIVTLYWSIHTCILPQNALRRDCNGKCIE